MECLSYIVPDRKLLFFPISASDSNYNLRNTQCIPVVNPAMAGSSSLILNPAVSGKHFETASCGLEKMIDIQQNKKTICCQPKLDSRFIHGQEDSSIKAG